MAASFIVPLKSEMVLTWCMEQRDERPANQKSEFAATVAPDLFDVGLCLFY